MKVTVIFRDYEVKARDRRAEIINAIKKRGWEIVRIKGGKDNLAEALKSKSLFEENMLYVLEDPGKLVKKDLDWLAKNLDEIDSNLLIYQKGNFPAKIKKILPKKTNYEEYKLPKILFTFLESLYPGNSKASIGLLRDLKKTDPIEFIFTLIGQTFRDLYWVKEDPSTIPYPSWRVGKLERQARRFQGEQIADMLKKVAEIDVKIKTGQAVLERELDKLILKDLV